MGKVWTPQQTAVFNWFEQGKGAMVVSARAGTGKTSTLLEALNYAPERRAGSVLLCAFNKRIQEELQSRAPRGVEVKTLHALGFAAVRNNWGRVRPDEKRGRAIVEEVVGRFAPTVVKNSIAKMASLGKLTLTTEAIGLQRLADAFDLGPSESLEEDGWTLGRFADLALEAMTAAGRQSDVIDFDDMLWVPAKRKLRPSQFDLVVVDECFPGDHPVLLADGTMMPIQDIVRGRLPVNVLSYDEATGKQVSKRVTGWHEKPLQKKTMRIVAQRVMYGNDGRRLNTTTARTKVGRRYIVCTEDHRIFSNGVWVEAKHLRPGDKLQFESGAPRAPGISQKYKHTVAGKAALRAGLAERQHALPRYRGGRIGLRGGNGRGPTYAQRVLKEALGHDWQTEFVVPLGRGRRSGWPTHYKIDIAHPGCRIAIEVDGKTHRTPERRAQDARKDRFLTENGWTVYRFQNHQAVQQAQEIAASMPRNCPVEAEVISVDDYPIKDLNVFDITVEDTHCYYVNGLLVHNCQDMNAAQLALARSALRHGGRIVVVGDDRQCIPGDEIVTTERGTMPIRDVEVGDKIVTAKGGARTTREVRQVSRSYKVEALRFTLSDGTTFSATADHTGFACLGEPDGYFLYLMHRSDMGFRVGITQKSGTTRTSFVVRSQQEGADALWVLGWYPNREEAALAEYRIALKYGVPTVPFNVRNNCSWATWNTKSLFQEFGQNGLKVVADFGLDLDRPIYRPKASGREAAVAVNVALCSKSGSEVGCETSNIDPDLARRLGMTSTARRTWRLRRYFAQLREALQFARGLAGKLGGYVVETLYGSSDPRRVFAVPMSHIHPGMMVPVLDGEGKQRLARVVARETVQVNDCYDLEVDGTGVFAVGEARAIVHNCLYSFMGVQLDALAKLKAELSATELPLTVTFRCPREVVRVAKHFVPDYEAAAEAPQGAVRWADKRDMNEGVRPGDFVLSRSNAGAVEACMAMLRKNVRAKVLGRDVGAGLLKLVDQLDTGAGLVPFLRRLSAWATEESLKARALDKPERAERVTDQMETIAVIAEGLTTMEGLRGRVRELFTDEASAERVICSTVHKAKGLEAQVAWVLTATFKRSGREEDNIRYVAATRAKSQLNLVTGDAGETDPGFLNAMGG